MQNVIPAEFHGTALSIIDHNGQKWLTAEEVGRCLGYNEANTRQGVQKLFERHGDEFADPDTCVVNLTTQGQRRAMRVFSASGCVLLSMFANTKCAKELRAWAKQVLSSQSPAPLALPDRFAIASEMVTDLLRTLQGQVQAQGLQIERLTRSLLTSKDSELRLRRQQAVADTQRRIDRVIMMEAEGLPRERIVTETGLSFNYIRQIVFKARKNGDLPRADARQGALL